MPFKDNLEFEGSLNDDQKTFLSTLTKTAREEAVNRFKTEDAEARKKAVPEKYDLKLGEKSPLTTEDIDKVSAYAKTNNLTNEQAQALLNETEARAARVIERQRASFAELPEKWKKDVEADKDLGGANYAATTQNVKRAMDHFGTEAFRKLVDDTGYGNHPEFVRVMNAIGKAMAENKGAGFGAGGGGQKDPAKRLYPNLA